MHRAACRRVANRLASSTRERDAYVDFLKKLNAEVRSPEEIKKAEEDLKATKEAEAAAFAELIKLEQEKAAVDDEIADLEEEARQLDLEEEKFWRERNALLSRCLNFRTNGMG
jgi:beclin 1